MNDERLTKLEIKFLHQEEFLNELNKVVVEQQKIIQRLEKDVLDLKREVNPMPDQGNQKPPHY